MFDLNATILLLLLLLATLPSWLLHVKCEIVTEFIVSKKMYSTFVLSLAVGFRQALPATFFPRNGKEWHKMAGNKKWVVI